MNETLKRISYLEEQLKNTRRLMYNASQQRNARSFGRLLKIEEDIIKERNKLMKQ